jgi:GH24 family phage-related lysozyme (muramidase)
MAEPRKITPNQAAGGIGALCVAAAAACLSLTQASEGLRNKPYLDPAHILTVCYGETQGIDQAKIYSNDECAIRLRKRLAEDYAPRIIACLPELTERRIKVFGALLDAAYNAGPVAVCNSLQPAEQRPPRQAGAAGAPSSREPDNFGN